MLDAEPAEAWDFYLTSMHEHRASIAVDLGLACAAPLEDRPWLCLVRFPLATPRVDGLSTTEEAPDLAELEDAVAHELGAACGARQVGRLTTRGRRELFFYARSTVELDAALTRIAEDNPAYHLTHVVRREDAWETFRDLLMPSPEEHRWILDRRVIDNLRDAGDASEVPRPVDHFMDFPERAAMEQTAVLLARQGFEVLPDREPRGGRWALRAVRRDPVTIEHIHDVSLTIANIVEAHHGEYDGWGAVVVRAE